jgi:hypothetical protein
LAKPIFIDSFRPAIRNDFINLSAFSGFISERTPAKRFREKVGQFLKLKLNQFVPLQVDLLLYV